MTIKLAVMSDLHCHPSDYRPLGTLLYSDPSPEAGSLCDPIQSLKVLIKERRLRADAMLCPGDLAHHSHPLGVTAGWKYVGEISKALGCGVTIGTPGNHDVDSRRKFSTMGEDVFRFVRGLGPNFPLAGTRAQRKFWRKQFVTLRSGDLRLVLVNSVAHHIDEHEAEYGMCSVQYLEELERELTRSESAKFQVAIVHHHPIVHRYPGEAARSSDLLAGGDDLLSVLHRARFNLIVHGHKHHPRLVYAPGGSSSLPVFAAGSFSAGNSSTNTVRNLFHIVTLSDELHSGCVRPGMIESYEYRYGLGWSKPNSGSASFPSLTGFGCRIPGSELALLTHEWLSERPVQLVTWEQLIAQFPTLNFLIPEDFDEYLQALSENHSIKVDFERNSDIPAHLGRAVGGGI